MSTKEFSVIMRPVGKMRVGSNIRIDGRIAPMPDGSGQWAWAVIEKDLEDGVEEMKRPVF